MIPVEQPGITFRLRSQSAAAASTKAYAGVSPWSATYVVDSLDILR